jgi:hypothetical protein
MNSGIHRHEIKTHWFRVVLVQVHLREYPKVIEDVPLRVQLPSLM